MFLGKEYVRFCCAASLGSCTVIRSVYIRSGATAAGSARQRGPPMEREDEGDRRRPGSQTPGLRRGGGAIKASWLSSVDVELGAADGGVDVW